MLKMGKDREGVQGKGYLDLETHQRASKKHGTREIPRNPQGFQLRLKAIVERMLKLALPYNQIDDYLNCHHRTFI